MSLRWRACAVLVAAAAVVTVASARPAAAQRPIKRVLMIHAGPEAFPGNTRLDEVITKVLYSHPTIEVEYYAEFLEYEEFGVAAETSLREYIRMKFRDRPLDALIANGAPALQFALQHRAELFPDVPIVFVSATTPREVLEGKVARVTGVLRGPSHVETLDLALKLHPATRRIHVVAYAPNFESYQEGVKSALGAFSSRVTLTYGNEPSLPEMLATLKTLPADSLILYARYSRGTRGRVIFPDEPLPEIAEAAPVPIYCSLDTYIGMGVVGGMMRSEISIATRVGEATLRILEGAKPEDIPVEAARVSPIFDWRQLQRWRIDESRLPPGADIRFRVPTVWELYSTYIIAAIVVVSALLLLITGLLAQRARLRTSYKRIRHMAGRLINAQEAARADIARDLHDDVCQKLASLSMGVNSLRSAIGNIEEPETQQLLEELDHEMGNTFEGIRRVSHDLHPATLRLLGLAPALRSHCNEVAKRHGVEVQFSSAEGVDTVHPDVAVSFFRIAQESLRNGIVHGGAKHLTVTLNCSGDQLDLAVVDDGQGFDVSSVQSNGGGLGLVTMEERVNLIGGDISVVSEAGRGTTVRVRGRANPNLLIDRDKQP